MPRNMPPGPYCPLARRGVIEPGGPMIILGEGEAARAEYLNYHGNAGAFLMAKGCAAEGIPCNVPVPRLVWHLAQVASQADLNPPERARCWDLARLILAEGAEQVRSTRGNGKASDDRPTRVSGGTQQ